VGYLELRAGAEVTTQPLHWINGVIYREGGVRTNIYDGHKSHIGIRKQGILFSIRLIILILLTPNI